MTISGKAALAGVIGWPVGHSLSPRLHGFWLAEHGIDGAYVPLAVKPDDLEDALRALSKLGFKGANVTVPHKEAALGLCDHVDPAAERVGAVNTVVVRDDGTLAGSNTDGFGFLENVRAGAPDYDPACGPVTVLGAGGAARAVIAALLDAGVPEVRLANRTGGRAEALARDLDPDGAGRITVFDWDVRADMLAGAVLLVNTTTLGMTGKPPLDLSLELLPSGAVVTDIVYAPLTTPLLAGAQARGNPVVDGLGMLLHQARPGFAAWFGAEPAVSDALRAHVLAGLD
jgi:shikimate dehydrogenase